LIEKVLTSISDSELAGLVGDLDIDLCEVLMKYVYRIMEKAPNSSLLKLHALLVDKAGLGCIVRVMTDRKTV
jgi:actin related protein 2/3 complex, subunit 5